MSFNNKNLFEFDGSFRPSLIIGTDEAGRGPGAGGVFASAVYFPNADDELIEKLSKLNDSKKLSKRVREELHEVIVKNTIHSTVCIEVEDIEKINILNASLKAMKLACENVINDLNNRLGLPSFAENSFSCKMVLRLAKIHPALEDSPQQYPAQQHQNVLVLVDGNKLIKDFDRSTIQPFNFSTTINQRCVVKGDSKSASIAAASILAKVSRDRYMQELHEKFPQYNWKQNAGYLTAEHLKAIDKYGITPCHRKSFLRKHEERNLQQSLNMRKN